MYSCRLFTPDRIHELESDWRELEKGEDMSYFQSFDWNCMLTRFLPKKTFFYESVLVAVFDEVRCRLIAPLLLIKHNYGLLNKKGCYFWARNDWSDYCNLIYSDFDEQGMNCLVSFVKSTFGINSFSFENLREKTKLYQYILNHYSIFSASKSVCVELSLPISQDEYLKLLSKSTKQNIRTANNRLKKDGKALEVRLDDKNFDFDRCWLIRKQRSEAKRKKKYGLLMSLKIKLIYEFLLYKIKEYNPLQADKNSHVLSVYDKNKLVAFFNYGIDTFHQSIVVMAAGIDSDYSRYSPGLLGMFQFICSQIEERKIKVIDFTRGNEQYKYHLGGKEHYISTLTFQKQ